MKKAINHMGEITPDGAEVYGDIIHLVSSQYNQEKCRSEKESAELKEIIIPVRLTKIPFPAPIGMIGKVTKKVDGIERKSKRNK